MKKREYKIIDNITNLLLKEVNSDFLRACDTLDGTSDTMRHCIENGGGVAKHNQTVKVAQVKSVGARKLATDIYKGLKAEYKQLGVGIFSLKGFYCVACKDIQFLMNDNGLIATNVQGVPFDGFSDKH